jgi:glycosyltransferase involved in cell wall biosynthesis
VPLETVPHGQSYKTAASVQLRVEQNQKSFLIEVKFSVIIPLYNKAPYIDKALRSVMAQTFADYQVIVVDDGSKDDSADIAERVLSNSSVFFRLIRQENAGVSAARNNGVAASQGDYLCFLDADDWWAPTFLEEMRKLIDEYPDAGIYGTSYTIINETKRKTRVAPIGVEPGFEKGYINYCQVYAKTLVMPLTSISVAIPRTVFDEMHGFPIGIKLGEDFLLWIRIALRHSVAFLNKPLACYNQDADYQWRATSHLQEPCAHMLWNINFLEEEEKKNSDYKLLIDNLRASNLLPYYLSKQYRKITQAELDKVDWSKQPRKTRDLYRKPFLFLKIRQLFLKLGSLLKLLVFKFI